MKLLSLPYNCPYYSTSNISIAQYEDRKGEINLLVIYFEYFYTVTYSLELKVQKILEING